MRAIFGTESEIVQRIDAHPKGSNVLNYLGQLTAMMEDPFLTGNGITLFEKASSAAIDLEKMIGSDLRKVAMFQFFRGVIWRLQAMATLSKETLNQFGALAANTALFFQEIPSEFLQTMQNEHISYGLTPKRYEFLLKESPDGQSAATQQLVVLDTAVGKLGDVSPDLTPAVPIVEEVSSDEEPDPQPLNQRLNIIITGLFPLSPFPFF